MVKANISLQTCLFLPTIYQSTSNFCIQKSLLLFDLRGTCIFHIWILFKISLLMSEVKGTMLVISLFLPLVVTNFVECSLSKDSFERLRLLSDILKEIEAIGKQRSVHNYISLMHQQKCPFGQIWRHGNCQKIATKPFKFDPWNLIKLFQRKPSPLASTTKSTTSTTTSPTSVSSTTFDEINTSTTELVPNTTEMDSDLETTTFSSHSDNANNDDDDDLVEAIEVSETTTLEYLF